MKMLKDAVNSFSPVDLPFLAQCNHWVPLPLLESVLYLLQLENSTWRHHAFQSITTPKKKQWYIFKWGARYVAPLGLLYTHLKDSLTHAFKYLSLLSASLVRGSFLGRFACSSSRKCFCFSGFRDKLYSAKDNALAVCEIIQSQRFHLRIISKDTLFLYSTGALNHFLPPLTLHNYMQRASLCDIASNF